MKQLKNAIIAVLIFICFLIPFAWSFFEFLALKPTSTQTLPSIPNDSTWEEDIKLFVGPEYLYDSSTGLFYNKTSMKSYSLSELYFSDDQFEALFSNANNKVIDAIINWRNNPNYKDNFIEADFDVYIPLFDKSLIKHVCDLDIEYLTNLLYYSKHTSTLAYHSQLRFSIDYILKRNLEYTDLEIFKEQYDNINNDLDVKPLNYQEYYSVSWFDKLIEDIESIPQRVEDGDIAELGLLAIPYITDKIELAATEEEAKRYSDLLIDIAEHVYDDIFISYKNNNKKWWINWSNNNELKIESIRNFIEFAKEYC